MPKSAPARYLPRMKVRHFGLPAIAPKHVAEASSSSSITLSKDADVHLEQGALHFPRTDSQGARSATPAAEMRAERAKLLLEVLRSDAGGTFGGRVRGGVDVAASLMSYFRSVEVAALAAKAGASDAANAFVADLDLPIDIRPLVELTVGGEDSPAPLGTNRAFEDDVNGARMFAALQQGDASTLKVTDKSLQQYFATNQAKRTYDYRNFGDAVFKCGVMRLFARAKELGLPVDGQYYNHTVPLLPADKDTARVMKRFAVAFGYRLQDIAVGNKPLSEWGANGAPVMPMGAPLGANTFTLAQWRVALAGGDVRSTRISDACVQMLATNAVRDIVKSCGSRL